MCSVDGNHFRGLLVKIFLNYKLLMQLLLIGALASATAAAAAASTLLALHW